MKTMDEDLVRF